MNTHKCFHFHAARVLPLLIIGLATVAHADTIFIQTDAATGGIFTDTSRVQASGTNDTPTLTLNAIPIISNLYSVIVQPFGGTKTSSSTTLSDHITLVQDNSITVFSGTFSFSQGLTETVTAGNATFAALAGSQFVIPLSNGRFLSITPLANSDLANNPVIQANFQLTSSNPVPEPSSMLLMVIGLAGFVASTRRRRKA